METSASFEARSAPLPYPTILGEQMETSASFEARSAPLPYPTILVKRYTRQNGLAHVISRHFPGRQLLPDPQRRERVNSSQSCWLATLTALLVMQTSQDWLKLAERAIEELTDRIYCRAAGPVNSSRVDWIAVYGKLPGINPRILLTNQNISLIVYCIDRPRFAWFVDCPNAELVTVTLGSVGRKLLLTL